MVVLLVFSLNLFQNQVRDLFYYFSAPIQRVLWTAGSNMSDFLTGVFKKSDLLTENKELRLDNQKIYIERIELKKLKEENKMLREALEIGLADDFKLADAVVTAKDAVSDAILIDKGFADGVEEDMVVITEQKVLLGKIGEVYKNFARVVLISGKESSFDAEILDKKIEGLVRGQGDQKIYLDRIPPESPIEEGDVVISSAFGGIYPRGLLVGRIGEVQKDDLKTFQQAEVVLFFNLRELRNVFIILK